MYMNRKKRKTSRSRAVFGHIVNVADMAGVFNATKCMHTGINNLIINLAYISWQCKGIIFLAIVEPVFIKLHIEQKYYILYYFISLHIIRMRKCYSMACHKEV